MLSNLSSRSTHGIGTWIRALFCSRHRLSWTLWVLKHSPELFDGYGENFLWILQIYGSGFLRLHCRLRLSLNLFRKRKYLLVWHLHCRPMRLRLDFKIASRPELLLIQRLEFYFGLFDDELIKLVSLLLGILQRFHCLFLLLLIFFRNIFFFLQA